MSIFNPRPGADSAPIDQHLTLLGLLHLAYSLLVGIVLAAVASMVTAGIVATLIAAPQSAPTSSPVALWPIWMVATALILLALIPLLLVILGVVSGIGLLQRRSWARQTALLQAALIVISVPLGTALGIYTFWVLTRSDAGPRFRPGQLRPQTT